MKYSKEQIVSDLRFIYDKYGELTSHSINIAHKEYNTVSLSVFDRIGTRDKLYELIDVEYKAKSFYDWCVENEQIDFIKSWSYDDNSASPKDISFSEHKEYWFICDKCGTKRKYNINSITNMNIKLKCPYCNSFEKWCIDNNPALLERFDYAKNSFKPSEISRGSKKLVYLMCENQRHESTAYMVKSITNGLINCHCSKCHSLAQWGIDTFGNDFLEKYWDYEKNVINPYDLSSSNHTKYIWIKCQNTNYHGSYKTKAVDLTRTSGIITCPYCYNTRVHKLDSLGHLYPDIIHLWSDKNTKSPYEYKPKSGQKAWFKCGCGKHSDTYRTICNAHHNDFECPDCVKERNESKLEECVRKYINNVLGYKTLHEHKCTITAINPNTRRPLPYDNEITSLKLIIEVHGIQHYVITNFANMAAKSFGTTPEYELSYLQWKDSYKKDFALKSGYYYLEIPYWAAKNDYYKIMIDDKIKEILKEAA